MKGANRLIVSILVIAVLAIGFWMLVISPKREEANELSSQIQQLTVSLEGARATAAEAEAARDEFPADYRQLVSLGKSVPAGDETASLLVELSRLAKKTRVEFDELQLNGSGEESAPVTSESAAAVPSTPPTEGAAGAVQAAATVPPTEAAASLLPLGATVGSAGLAVMPYNVTFRGGFFQIAEFMHEIDSLVRTKDGAVSNSGRLLTVDGFSLANGAEGTDLDANFAVNTYVIPPGLSPTAGASPTAPPPVESVPATGGSSGEEAASSEAVSAR